MKRIFKVGIVGLLVVAALAALAFGTVWAQDDPPPPEDKPFGGRMWGRGLGFHLGGVGHKGLEAAAEALGMTVEELTAELHSGNPLSDLAEAAGVDVDDVRAAMTAAMDAAIRAAIEQAVEDGDLSEGHGDWLLEGLEQGYWSSRGFGGFGGRGFFGRQGGFHGRPGGDYRFHDRFQTPGNGTSTSSADL